MTIRQVAGTVLATLLLPAALLAQNPAKYIGDDGASSPGKSRNVLGTDGTGNSAAGAAMNLSAANRRGVPLQNRSLPIIYEKYARQDPNDPNSPFVTPLTKQRVTIAPTPGTHPPRVLPTAKEWLQFLRDRVPNPDDIDYDGRADAGQQPAAIAISPVPPRQTILVVDQGHRKKEIDSGRNPEVVEYTTISIVKRWTTADPIYENHTVVGYPCCCNITFSLLVGYKYTEHIETESQQIPKAQYKTDTIAVDRGIIVNAGNPQYTTQIPRLCEFHYGPGATFTAPVVPIIADINDKPAGGSTSTTGGSTTASFNSLITSENSSYVSDINEKLLYTNEVKTVNTGYSTTTIIPVGTYPLVQGTAPSGNNYGGFVLGSGQTAAPVTIPGDDRGTQQHPNDRAYVVDATTTTGLETKPTGNPDETAFLYRIK